MQLTRLLCLFLCLCWFNLEAAQLSWTSDLESVTFGDEFIILVQNDTEGETLNAYDLELSYPNHFCEFIDFDQSQMEFNFKTPLSYHDNKLGVLKVNDLDVDGFRGKFNLIALKFRVKENVLEKGSFQLNVTSYTNLEEIDLIDSSINLELDSKHPSVFGSSIFPSKIYKNSEATIHVTVTNNPYPQYIDYQWYIGNEKLIGERGRLTLQEALDPDNFKLDLSTKTNVHKDLLLSCNLTPIKNSFLFSTVSPEQMVLNSAPIVLAENDKSTSVGNMVTLSSNAYDIDEDELSYQWTLLSSGNLELLNKFHETLSVNVIESGRFTFRVEVSDGLENDFDEVSINVDPVFIDESSEDNNGETLPVNLDNSINELTQLDLEDKSSINQAIELAFELVQTEIQVSDRRTLLSTLSQIASGNQSSVLTQDQKSMILTSLDHSVDEENSDLSNEEMEQIFTTITSLASRGTLEITQVSKSIEIIDEMIESQFIQEQIINKEMTDNVYSAIDVLFSEISEQLDESQEYIEFDYENLDLYVAKINLSNQQTTTQGNLNSGYQMMVPSGTLNEIIQVKIIRQSFNPHEDESLAEPQGDIISFEIFGLDHQEIDEFENHITLTIPFNLSNLHSDFTFVPKYYDTNTLNWSEVGISNVVLNEVLGTVQFDVNHLTDFATFREEVSEPTTIIDSSEVTETVINSSSGGGGGGGGCLLSRKGGMK